MVKATFHFSAAVGDAVRKLFSKTTAKKRVAVAYVGTDPVEAMGGVSAIKGMTVYCWPKPGATNPVGISDLVEAGAMVRLVNGLHAKVYWTPYGALIGSSNLSQNGLSDTGGRP
jgi:hypothetical protein